MPRSPATQGQRYHLSSCFHPPLPAGQRIERRQEFDLGLLRRPTPDPNPERPVILRLPLHRSKVGGDLVSDDAVVCFVDFGGNIQRQAEAWRNSKPIDAVLGLADDRRLALDWPPYIAEARQAFRRIM
ncbi:hypothetical protein A4U53_030645 [Rhizobium ruizarguesonis]|uniref:Uncharacterized protein n=1 Tax=Rhizobium ruizarguesonis TaxID=2081791 RepID=A0ACD5EMF9_9HYPH